MSEAVVLANSLFYFVFSESISTSTFVCYQRHLSTIYPLHVLASHICKELQVLNLDLYTVYYAVRLLSTRFYVQVNNATV